MYTGIVYSFSYLFILVFRFRYEDIDIHFVTMVIIQNCCNNDNIFVCVLDYIEKVVLGVTYPGIRGNPT